MQCLMKLVQWHWRIIKHVKSRKMDKQMEWETDDERQAIRKIHLSFQLSWAKSEESFDSCVFLSMCVTILHYKFCWCTLLTYLENSMCKNRSINQSDVYYVNISESLSLLCTPMSPFFSDATNYMINTKTTGTVFYI